MFSLHLRSLFYQLHYSPSCILEGHSCDQCKYYKGEISSVLRQRNAHFSQRHDDFSNSEPSIYTQFQNSPFYLTKCKHDHLFFCLILLREELLLFPNKHFRAGHILREDAVVDVWNTPAIYRKVLPVSMLSSAPQLGHLFGACG